MSSISIFIWILFVNLTDFPCYTNFPRLSSHNSTSYFALTSGILPFSLPGLVTWCFLEQKRLTIYLFFSKINFNTLLDKGKEMTLKLTYFASIRKHHKMHKHEMYKFSHRTSNVLKLVNIKRNRNYFIPLRRLQVAILKWPIPLADFYLNSGQFLVIVANFSNL